MYWFSVFIVAIFALLIELLMNKNFIKLIVFGAISILVTVITVAIDYDMQVTDYEIWSGSVVDWNHEEEWDEWHPPEEECETDSEGNETCEIIDGYYEHHYAENYIKTSDKGWIYVSQSPDGKQFDDSWPNDDSVLKEYWPLGTPSASKHRYVNKINASYSIYKHPDVDLNQYPDLPEYPLSIYNLIEIDRIIGNVPNKKEANHLLSQENTRLNTMVVNPETGKSESWKQVNMIFVNVGPDKTSDYGFALQDYWQGGNKNDYVVSFSMNEDGTINWVYPFSWSESEKLKLKTRNYFLDLDKIDDFSVVVKDISKMVEEGFERKSFSDFNYLQITPTKGTQIFIWVFNILLVIISLGFSIYETKTSYNVFGSSKRNNRNSFYNYNSYNSKNKKRW